MDRRLIDLLRDGNHSLVVDNGAVRTFDGRGIADLYALATAARSPLNGAAVADKVVGKGAAALMVIGGVTEVYAETISTPGLALLRGSNVSVDFGREVPEIINRQSTGPCPVEQLCRDCTSATECLPLIADFLSNQFM